MKLLKLITAFIAANFLIFAIAPPALALDYYPYGSARQSEVEQLPTDHLYTGQQWDGGEIGLYYYNARYYDPDLGIFTSADRAQGPNRYAYVMGNPIMNNDPTGQTVVSPLPIILLGPDNISPRNPFDDIGRDLIAPFNLLDIGQDLPQTKPVQPIDDILSPKDKELIDDIRRTLAEIGNLPLKVKEKTKDPSWWNDPEFKILTQTEPGIPAGLSHLTEGNPKRIQQRKALAVQIAETLNSSPEKADVQCWSRGWQAGPGSTVPARALVIEDITFLHNLQTGDRTLMKGNVPLDQLSDWEFDPRTGVMWQPGDQFEKETTMRALFETLEFYDLEPPGSGD